MQAWITHAVKAIDQDSIDAAKAHQCVLTKPPGSLGQLELLAEQFAGWQATVSPCINDIYIAVFAADHGVCQQHISAFPQSVTTQMITNFLQGGAAISVLSQALDADFCVVNMGTVCPIPKAYQDHPQLINVPVAQGSADFSAQAAMTDQQLQQALDRGRAVVEHLSTSLFIGGEMGIGNTTAASAICAALLPLPLEQLVGPGTGLDQTGIRRKQDVIKRALVLHQPLLDDPYQVLRCVGGLEIAALVGSYVACAQRGIPVLVDGFICSAAALLAVRVNPDVRQWLLFSHQSAEPAHELVLKELSAQPLIKLDMRLGEGSGAAVAVPIIQAALRLHNQMATFTQAGVSESTSNE